MTPTNPTQTRRDTIEAAAVKVAEALDAARNPDASAALASAEHPAREEGEDGVLLVAGRTLAGMHEAVVQIIERYHDGDIDLAEFEHEVTGTVTGTHEADAAKIIATHPAPAPAAETDGLVERLTRDLERARAWEKAILEDNERKAFCIRELVEEREGRRRPPEIGEALAKIDLALDEMWNDPLPRQKALNKHYRAICDAQAVAKMYLAGSGIGTYPTELQLVVGEIIELCKADHKLSDDAGEGPSPYTQDILALARKADALTSQLTARTQPPEIAEALANLVADVDALINDTIGVAGLHLNGDVAEWSDITEGGRHEGWLSSLEPARRLLASTGSRQEPAGGLTARQIVDRHTFPAQPDEDNAVEVDRAGLVAEIERALDALHSQPASQDKAGDFRKVLAVLEEAHVSMWGIIPEGQDPENMARMRAARERVRTMIRLLAASTGSRQVGDEPAQTFRRINAGEDTLIVGSIGDPDVGPDIQFRVVPVHDEDDANAQADAVIAAIRAPSPRGDIEAPCWRHVKRGTEYVEIGRATLQDARETLLAEDDVVVVYRGSDGKLWAREVSEFEDGRFERLPASRSGSVS